MINAAIIGMGSIGNIHARAYRDSKDVNLTGVCDIIRGRAEKAAWDYGVPWYSDAAEMLKELKPDLVSVTTGGFEYASDHYKPTIQALEAGCAVLGEKPISNNIEKAREMVNFAAEKNLCYAINLNHRFTPACLEAKKWQDEGRVGDVLFCNMSLWIGKFGEFGSPYFHLKALNPHSVDIMRYFCGEVKEVQCFAVKAPGRSIWSSASVNMLFESGAVGHLTSSYDIARSHNVEKCEVAGTRGRIAVDDMWLKSTLYPADSMVQTVYQNPVFGGYTCFEDTFKARIDSFVNEIKENKAPKHIDGSGADGLAASRVIHAAILSLEEKRVVGINEI
ncbi:MAG: Gfo/Idh/MocA family oxidoreductase [Oscillospiraceae bacterium]|nr:Gfo/Idh/MocA family oxidoreductase [Oscillospiraceae bacterium]